MLCTRMLFKPTLAFPWFPPFPPLKRVCCLFLSNKVEDGPGKTEVFPFSPGLSVRILIFAAPYNSVYLLLVSLSEAESERVTYQFPELNFLHNFLKNLP